MQVVERDCRRDYPGQKKTAAANGDCVCDSNTIELGGTCVSTTIVAVSASLLALVIVSLLGAWFIRYKSFKSDQMWMVNAEDLHFDDPVEVIGSGSFGQVLKAEYRGTTVAIKRVLKTRANPKANKSGSTASPKSVASNADGHSTDPNASTQSGSKGSVGSESMDLEAQSSTEFNQDSTGSTGADLGFLADGFSFGDARPKGFAKFMPWTKQTNAGIKAGILGNASGVSRASMSKSTFIGKLVPCFDAHARRKNEFILEMRLLSRLRVRSGCSYISKPWHIIHY